MEDLNDLYFFASVVQYGGFSAAARTIGVEKTRLSRRIAALEKRLGVRLLQRTTRALSLTEAGQRFYDRCLATVEGAQAAFDSVAELRREPAGLVRLSSPVLLTQRCLAHALPGYMARHPKVSVFVEPTDRTVNVIEERFDIVIRAKPVIEDVAGLVAKTLGSSQRVMVVSRNFLDQYGRPETPVDLPKFNTVASTDDLFDGGARWTLTNLDNRTQQIALKPRLVTSDLRVRLQAAVRGIGSLSHNGPANGCKRKTALARWRPTGFPRVDFRYHPRVRCVRRGSMRHRCILEGAGHRPGRRHGAKLGRSIS
jgi:DNA-binding transcriptional LysR family regulator